MRYLYEEDIHYSKHPLKRVLTVTSFLSADYVEGQYTANDPHDHQDAWELAYCASGHLTVKKGSLEKKLSPSQFTLTAPGTVHDYSAPELSSRFFVLCFTLSGEENLLPFKDEIITSDSFQKGLFSRMIVEVCNAYEYDPRLEERIKVLDFQPSKKDPLGGEQIIASSLEMVLLYALRSMTMQGDEVVRAEGLQKAVRDYLVQSVQGYIEENASIRLCVRDIAGHFNYSRTYLSSLFREAAGQTIKDTVTAAILKRAKEELCRNQASVSSVAAGLGFDSVQYFSHWFKRNTGLSPSEYLKKEVSR